MPNRVQQSLLCYARRDAPPSVDTPASPLQHGSLNFSHWCSNERFVHFSRARARARDACIRIMVAARKRYATPWTRGAHQITPDQ